MDHSRIVIQFISPGVDVTSFSSTAPIRPITTSRPSRLGTIAKARTGTTRPRGSQTIADCCSTTGVVLAAACRVTATRSCLRSRNRVSVNSIGDRFSIHVRYAWMSSPHAGSRPFTRPLNEVSAWSAASQFRYSHRCTCGAPWRTWRITSVLRQSTYCTVRAVRLKCCSLPNRASPRLDAGKACPASSLGDIWMMLSSK
jgi:hypothetical protein